MPDVYDREEEKEFTPSPDGSHDDLGVHPERKEAELADMERNFALPSRTGDRGSSVSGGDLAQREASAGSQTAGEESGLFRDDKPGVRDRLKARLNKRDVKIGGIGGVLIAAAFAMLGVIQGPLQIVHFAQLLQDFHFSNNDDHSNYRTARYIFYFAVGQGQRGRLGFVGDKYAETWEKRLNNDLGLKSKYSDPPRSRFEGFDVIDSDKAKASVADMEREGVTIERNPDGSVRGVRVDPGNGSFRRGRSVTRTAVRGTGTNKVASFVGARLLKKRGGIDFHPLKNIVRRGSDSLIKYYGDRKKARSEYRKTGVEVPDPRIVGEPKTDAEGNVIDDTTDVANETQAEIDEAKRADTPDKRQKLVGKLVSRGGMVGSVAGTACAAKSIGDQIPDYQYANIILPMMRMGGEIVTVGSQVMTNQDVNVDELGSLVTDFYDEVNGSSWAEARSVQHELNKDLTGPDIPPGAKPSRVGEKPALFDALDRVDGLKEVCGVMDSVGDIPIIGRAVNTAGDLSEDAINLALTPTGFSMEELMNSVVAFFAGEVVNTYAAGAELGNIANYGSRLAANDQAIGSGGVELTAAQVAQLDQLRYEKKQGELQSKSFFARTFDIYDADSVVAKASMEMPHSTSQAVASLVAAPGRLFSSVFSFGKARANTGDYDYGFSEYGFSKELQEDERFQDPFENVRIMDQYLASANAAEQACAAAARARDESPYPQCESGYSSLRELNTGDSDFSTSDGDDNEAPGSDTPDKLKAGSGYECFGLEVDQTLNVTNHAAVNYQKLPPECTSDLEIFLRYRFYVTDTLTTHSLGCYEGEEASCAQVGMTSAQTGGPAGGASGVTGSATAPCVIGQPYLTDGRGATSTDGIFLTGANHDIPIRVCLVQGFAVNVQIESAVNDMVNDAKAAGVELKSASAFRSYEHQVALRRQNCGTSDYAIYQMPSSQCSPETAKPGSSNHEDGLAIDFDGVSKCPNKVNGSCADPSNASWSWLSQNASRYGFQQYSREAWHWSVNGG